MKIMQGSSREDTHWGQCFEEFYGPEYCKNLRKDLEKLKDEFYDGNPQRFQREWVMPTALLLRRMRYMGFPVRTKEYVLIHLYNPVDSMSSGEMHFQVGRKIPGTLTLKFTKQNTGGVFVIQPKTLSGPDELKLNEDPVRYFDEVRREMRDSSMDSAVQLTTLVLMTDLCKLERKSLEEFLQGQRRIEHRVPPPVTGTISDLPPSCPPTSIPFNSGHWAALNMSNLFNPESLTRPDANFPFPWNFCVKNYVNYGGRDGKPTTEVGVSMQNPNSGIATAAGCNAGHYNAVGTSFRQNRSTTWHSEPEENDETLNMYSVNEQQWDKVNRTPAQGVEEIQRRMSDSKLWDAPKLPPTTKPDVVHNSGSAQLQRPPTSTQTTRDGVNSRPNRQIGTATRTAVRSDVRTNFTEDYAGEASCSPTNNTYSPEILLNDGAKYDIATRRDSETRTSLTDQYLTGTSPSNNHNSYELCCSPSEGATGSNPLNFVSERRTSHTEAYAGESPRATGGKNPFNGAFTDAMKKAARDSSHTNGGHLDSANAATRGRSSPRATVTEEYCGNEPNQNTRLPLPSSLEIWAHRQRTFSGSNQLAVPTQTVSGNLTQDDFSEKTRTSSLDAYVGESALNELQKRSSGISKSHSTGDVSQQIPPSSVAGRTTVVDEYLGEKTECDERRSNQQLYVQRHDQPRQTATVHFRSPAASYSGSSSYGSDVTNGHDSNEGFDSTTNGFESWGSHCPTQPPGGAASAAGHQQQWRLPLGGAGGRLCGVGPRVAELNDENEMSLWSQSSFPSWGSHHCGANANSSYNGIMIPLTVEEYNWNLIQDGGGGGSVVGGSGSHHHLPSDS